MWLLAEGWVAHLEKFGEQIYGYGLFASNPSHSAEDLRRKGEESMLIILIILLLVFGFGGYRMGPGIGYYGGGGLSLILLIVLVLLLLRVI